MDARRIHAEAIKRHRHYEQHGRRAPSKVDRFRQSWPAEERREYVPRNKHTALLVRRVNYRRFV